MTRSLVVRLVSVVFIAWIVVQPPAHAQSIEDIKALNSQVVQLYNRGKYVEATKIAEPVLSRVEKALGPEHPDTLWSVTNLGMLYEAQARYREAEPLYRRALAGYEKAQGPEHPNTLTSVNNLGALYHGQGQYREAELLYRRALAGYEKTLGAEHSATLRSVNNLGVLYRAQGRYREAEPLYRRALAGNEKALGPGHPNTLKSVNNLAALFQAQGRHSEAEPLLKRVLAGSETALGPEHPDTLTSVNNLARLYDAQGRYDEAELLYQRALTGNENALGPEHPDTLTSVNSLAGLFQAQGSYSEAEPLYQRALAGRRKVLGPEHPDTLRSVNNLGWLYDAQGRHSDAEPLYRQALAGREKTLGPGHPDTLRSVNNLGTLYDVQGRYDDAELLYRRALAGREKALGPEHPDTLISVNNLAALFQAQGRYDDAEPLYRRALAGREKALGPEHPDTLTSVNNLAALLQAQGRYREAEPLLNRALASYQKALGPEHPDTLRTVNNLGGLYYTQGRHSEAEPLWKQALAGREKMLGPEHPLTLLSVGNLATLSFAQRDWQEAAQYWRRSTTAIVKRVQRGVLATGLTGKKDSEAEQNSWQFWGLISATYRLAPDGVTPDPKSASAMFQTAQWALSSEAARSLTQMAARGAKGDPALVKLVRERQDLVDEWQRREKVQAKALGQEAAKRDAKDETENRKRMAAIDLLIAEIDEQLKVKFPDYAALASPPPLAVEAVQAQLGADEALVLFLDTPKWQTAPEETFIWVVTKSEMRWVRSDLGQAALAREVQALRCGLDGAAWEGQSRCPELTGQSVPGKLLPFDHARAHRLYLALFGKIKDLLEGKHLLVVPSGALTQLPFAVLLTAQPDGDNKAAAWLVRDHAITVLPAVSSLKALRATSRPSIAAKPLIGFGNPLLYGTDEKSPAAKLAREKQTCTKSARWRVGDILGFRRSVAPIETRSGFANVSLIRGLDPLPETADELCAVASDAGAELGDIRLGARATEQEIKRMSKAGDLAQYRVVHFATHGAMAGELKGSSEPGLILTPPDTATEGDDGYLSASEIAGLKLDADWVILSACNTAAGDAPNTEALSGLARAFFYAQARALLVSHWAVNSDATVKLITAAMRGIARNKSIGRAEALRRAMVAMIDKGEAYEAHPAFWAPFIVVGEGTR